MSSVILPARSCPTWEASRCRRFRKTRSARCRRRHSKPRSAPARKLLAKGNIKPTEVCLVGNAGDELCAYAKKKKLDVLVMGSHGYGAFKAAVLGSVATRVMAHSNVPLLLVRHA